MLRQGAIIIASFIFASSVLFTSIFRTAAPQYAFSQAGFVQGVSESTPSATVDYYLPYPGILPDHFLWPLKAFRDRVWLFVIRDPMKKADVLLLFADKRIGMARELIRGGKPELGVTTAQKAGQYLEEALIQAEKAAQNGVDTGELLEKLAKASLKHKEVLESIIVTLPEEGRPVLNEVIDHSRRVYEKSAQRLNEVNRPVPTVSPPSPTPHPTPAL